MESEKKKNVSVNYRCERKFFLTSFEKADITTVISRHPAFFSEIFYERTINNIYLDTYDAQYLFDGIDGVSHRKKIRIRWYGDTFGEVNDPRLEFKIKDGHWGYKKRAPLSNFILDTQFSKKRMHTVLSSSALPADMHRDVASLYPSILNSYARCYFQSTDKKFRITIDSGIKFYLLLPEQNNFEICATDPNVFIVELKYDEKYDEEARSITNYFPFRMTKSSKYVMGLEKFYSL